MSGFGPSNESNPDLYNSAVRIKFLKPYPICGKAIRSGVADEWKRNCYLSIREVKMSGQRRSLARAYQSTRKLCKEC